MGVPLGWVWGRCPLGSHWGPHQRLPGQQLQQPREQLPVAEVAVEVPHAAADVRQVGVHPFGEGLLLHRLPFVCGEGGGRH